MGIAMKCDVCGALVEQLDALTLEVHLPTGEENLSQGWAEIDVCKECLSLPLGAIILETCEGCEESPLMAPAPSDGMKG